VRNGLKQQLKDLSSSSQQELKTFWEQTEIAQQLNRVLDTNLQGDNTPSKIFKKKDNPAPLNTNERDSSLINSLREASSPYGDRGDKAITITLDFRIQDKLNKIEERVGRAGDTAFPYSFWKATSSDPQTGKADRYLKGNFDTMKKKARKLQQEGNRISERLKLLRQLHADETEINRRTNS